MSCRTHLSRLTPGMKLCCLLVFAVNVIAVTAPAAELTRAAISGVVEDDRGERVAGATVWLVGGKYDEDAKPVAEVTTDPVVPEVDPIEPDEVIDDAPVQASDDLVAQSLPVLNNAIRADGRTH